GPGGRVIFVGIDPGKSGAIAALDASGAFVSAEPTPMLRRPGERPTYDLREIRQILVAHVIEHRGRVFATIEKQQALPARGFGRGGAGVGGTLANFARGEASGWAWMLTAIGIGYTWVSPKTWQRDMLDAGGGDTGDRSVATAHRLWPKAALTRTPRCTKLD